MASPWKFLTRLISPRRQRKQDGAAIGVEPDVAAIAEQTGTPVGESVDQPMRENPTRFVETDGPVEPEPPLQTGGAGRDAAQSNSDGAAGTSEPATHGISATIALAPPRGKRSAKAALRQRGGLAKKIATVGGRSQRVEAAPKISDEISLDQEIKMLRIELIGKLRLQNAQLKKMLERFED